MTLLEEKKCKRRKHAISRYRENKGIEKHTTLYNNGKTYTST